MLFCVDAYHKDINSLDDDNFMRIIRESKVSSKHRSRKQTTEQGVEIIGKVSGKDNKLVK